MNSAAFAAVQAIAGHEWSWPWRTFLLLFAWGASSCVQVDGGAIELSWTLRTFDGEVINSNQEEACSRARLEAVRVCWQRPGSGVDAGGALECDVERSRTFECRDDRGVTRFELEPGPTAIWIEPMCADGQPPEQGTFEVPAPIVREIRDGEVAALRTLLIVATDGDQDCPPAGCTCSSP